jgi:NADH:ubiquinone oxidoreductase subunit 6 (subunit J)
MAVLHVFWYTDWTKLPDLQTVEETAPDIGKLFLSSYVLPFEVASVILLVALIGAAMIARRGRKV